MLALNVKGPPGTSTAEKSSSRRTPVADTTNSPLSPPFRETFLRSSFQHILDFFFLPKCDHVHCTGLYRSILSRAEAPFSVRSTNWFRLDNFGTVLPLLQIELRITG